MAYLLDPAEGKYRLEDLALRFLSVEVRVARCRGGHPRLRRRRGEWTRPAGGRWWSCAWRRSPRRSTRELADLYERFERPLVRVLARMEEPASRSTASSSRSCAPSSRSSATRLVRRIHAHAGEEFNVNSTPQLRVILFEKLGLAPVKKTKTGPSTDADSLQKMAEEHPIVEDLLRYREVEKLRSTYAERCRRSSAPTAACRDVQADRHDHRPHLERGARTSRTCRCARPTAGRCAGRSSPRTAGACSPPTTRRSSCGCSRTSPTIRASSTRSSAAPTSTPPTARQGVRRRRSRRSTPSSAGSPRS